MRSFTEGGMEEVERRVLVKIQMKSHWHLPGESEVGLWVLINNTKSAPFQILITFQ